MITVTLREIRIRLPGATSDRQEAGAGVQRGVRDGRVHRLGGRSSCSANDPGRCKGVRAATIQRQEEEATVNEENCLDEIVQRGILQLFELCQRIRGRRWES